MSEKELIAIEYYGKSVHLVYKYRGETFKKALQIGTHRLESLK